LDPTDPVTVQMVAAYQAGATLTELAGRHHFCREAVALRLRRAGVQIRQGRPRRVL
jgi:hypothetical protein